LSESNTYRCSRFGGEGACDEDRFKLKSIEGVQFLAAVPLIEGQVRVSMAGMVGMDVAGCLAILRSTGIEESIAAIFVAFWEQGRLLAASDMAEGKEA